MLGRWRYLAGYIFCATLLTTTSSADLSVSSLWKAMAFEAQDKIASLEIELKQKPWESKEANFIKCQIVVQFAFIMHITHEDIAHKKESDGEAFHFILNGGEKEGLFDLVYVYTREGKHHSTRVDLLPKDWHLMYMPQGPGATLGLRSANGRCIFGLDLRNPFNAIAIDPAQ